MRRSNELLQQQLAQQHAVQQAQQQQQAEILSHQKATKASIGAAETVASTLRTPPSTRVGSLYASVERDAARELFPAATHATTQCRGHADARRGGQASCA